LATKRIKRMMRIFSALLLMMLLAGGLAFMAAAQSKAMAGKDAMPASVVVDVVKLSGRVNAIDLEKKTVSIEVAGGRRLTVNAKHARNLDQVKVGDKVNLEFVEEMALFVRKSDAPPSATEAQAVQLAPKGQKPGGLMVQTIELTGHVESIDTVRRTIALKGPAGNVRMFRINKQAKNFGQIKKGDQVVLRYTEAVALSVVRP
jgi:ribosomal 50S subunit-recycling heat shock protein